MYKLYTISSIEYDPYTDFSNSLLALAAPAISRERIAVCANLAAIRALDAKASGSDYPTQSHMLDLTFVLCVAGSSSEG